MLVAIVCIGENRKGYLIKTQSVELFQGKWLDMSKLMDKFWLNLFLGDKLNISPSDKDKFFNSSFVKVAAFNKMDEARQFIEENKWKSPCTSCIYWTGEDILPCAVNPILASSEGTICNDYRCCITGSF